MSFNALARTAQFGQFAGSIRDGGVQGAERRGGIARAIKGKTADAKAAGGKILGLDGDAVAVLVAQYVLVGGARGDQVAAGEFGAVIDADDLIAQCVEG